MKRFALAAAAALTLAGPLASTAAYADPPGRHDNRGQDQNRRGDNDRNDRGDRNDNNRWNDNRNDNRRSDNRWDDRRNNGYTMNGQWHYGPPPAAYQNRAQVGYRAWRRGDRLPAYYQHQYRQVDYRRAHLRAPPRGYHYVQDDRGQTLLVGIATGAILSILLSGN
ncbi:MAG: RcnB family protein [Terricaulis sp.]